MTLFNTQTLKHLVIIMLLVLVSGCSGTSANGTGSIAAKLAWRTSKVAVKGVAALPAAPAGVVTVRIIISGSGMTTMQQDFAVSAGTGSISGVPVGGSRTVTVRGLDSSGAVLYEGAVGNITVQQGQTTDAGTITMLPLAAPDAPSGLTATAVSISQINLAWTDASVTETGFKIERKTGSGGTYAQIGTVAANAVSYADTGLTAATTYYYRVRATNSAGDSGYTVEAHATTPTIQLPKTGQTVSQAAGDDGALQKGVAWPSPRFTDNSDGTVTDNLTGLVWLKNANCTDTAGVTKASGYLTWYDAMAWCNFLAAGVCGLSDGSTTGQWRLPNYKELQSLVDRSQYSPALPSGHPFTGVQGSRYYWSSSSSAVDSSIAWVMEPVYGGMMASGGIGSKMIVNYVWPVRAGQ